MNGGLDEAELTLTERLLNIVEVVQSRVPNDFLDCLNPSELLIEGLQVVGTGLRRWENEGEGVKDGLVIKMLLWLILDEHTNQVVHALVLVFLPVLVHVELLSKEAIPILFELGLGGFADHLSLYLNGILFIWCKE